MRQLRDFISISILMIFFQGAHAVTCTSTLSNKYVKAFDAYGIPGVTVYFRNNGLGKARVKADEWIDDTYDLNPGDTKDHFVTFNGTDFYIKSINQIQIEVCFDMR